MDVVDDCVKVETDGDANVAADVNVEDAVVDLVAQNTLRRNAAG